MLKLFSNSIEEKKFFLRISFYFFAFPWAATDSMAFLTVSSSPKNWKQKKINSKNVSTRNAFNINPNLLI